GLYGPRHRLLGQCLARMPGILLPCGVMIWWALRDQGLIDAAPAGLHVRDDEWLLIVCLALVGCVQLAVRRWTHVGEFGAGVAAVLGLFVLAASSQPDGALTLGQAPLALLAPLSLMVLARPLNGQVLG